MQSREIIKLSPLKPKTTKTCIMCKTQFKSDENNTSQYCEECQDNIDAEKFASYIEYIVLGDMDEKNR